jgi:DNA-directed RNA polymerase subunit F
MNTVSKFKSEGQVHNMHPGPAMDPEKRQEVKNEVNALISAMPNLSIRKMACAVDTSYSTVRSILIDELHLKPYKYHMCHKLQAADYEKRLDFARWYLSRPTDTPKYFICSDEAYFYLTESVNKQNNRMWCESRPSNWIEVPLQDSKIHVWCAISANRIFGPYYFEETVNKDRYLDMLQTFFWPKMLNTADRHKYFFQQDGAAAHTANIVQAWCSLKFGEKFLDKKMWPPRSPDLNPCDFFLWGYLKSVVYNPLPKTIDELKANLEREIKKINKETLEKLFFNLSKRCNFVISAQGGHFENK